MTARILVAVAALVTVAGCRGAFDAHAGDKTAGPGGGEPLLCPQDPDCFATDDDCRPDECPGYWVCETFTATMGKRCTNPGPDYPDDNGGWNCADRDGTTQCRRRGDDFPDGGGGEGWNCRRSGEFVVCDSDSPDYPDGHGDGPWACRYEGEFRVCENNPPEGPGDEGGWSCHDTADGRECRQSNPDYPDDGEWSCYDAGGETICTRPGPDVPADYPGPGGGEPWDCRRSGEFVECRSDEPDYPDGGGDGPWACRYIDEFRVCDDTPDMPPYGSECVPRQQRWCDDAVLCSWGKQTCLPDGTWGPCIEPERDGPGRLLDRPNNACGCRHFFFNDECCEDQEDRDHDGKPDCLIPEGHTAPACESDGSLCSFCDVEEDCGGDMDMCLISTAPGSIGYAFCSRDCSDSPCPSGYACQPIRGAGGRTIQQCVPTAGYCE